MTIRFVARAAGVDEEPDYEYLSAGVSENVDGSGFVLIFQCGLDEPDEQDVALGMDSYCLITADEGTAYGCVTEVVLTSSLLRVVVRPDALESLELDDTEIEATLDVDQESLDRLSDGLRLVLNYGRPSARPVIRLS